ncbi:MAG: efflux RND transporter periplasmic adaptor subunit [Thermodesulfovibrio sp.]|jgi:HlyD family secretion protein|uniref:Efflux transporter periplasmic adaptor subunit n=2 Tax=Thermodesulfovibrio TaxID=28261 RepID=A0A2J6WKW4_9BACT|nr:MAG: efflux transporter periplasmic adaptor subunit [Thermodesulfovibrio aggregans]
MVKSVYASGFIDSSDSLAIKTEVSGYVKKIMVKEGQEVKKGQLLLIISNETLMENLKDLDAQIALVKERLAPNSDFKKDLLHNIEIKKAIFENVEKNFIRRKALYEEELISKEKFEEIKREYEVAKRDYERQINQYNDAIKNLNYQLESLNAKRKALKSEIDKYYIKSPISGKILRKFVNEGEYVNPLQQNSALFSVGNEKNLETVLFVDEEYIPKVKTGMKVYITLDSYPGEIFEGRIKSLESQSDRATRTVKVKADVNYGKPVFFGLTVEANIIIDEIEGIFIPEKAYQNGYVEVLDGNRVKKIKVKVSPEKYNGYLLVIEGLEENQELVIR